MMTFGQFVLQLVQTNNIFSGSLFFFFAFFFYSKQTVNQSVHIQICRSSCSLLCSLQPDCLNPVTKLRILRQGKGDSHIKKTFFCFHFSQLLFLCLKFNAFVFIICLCIFIAANKTHLNKQVYLFYFTTLIHICVFVHKSV